MLNILWEKGYPLAQVLICGSLLASVDLADKAPVMWLLTMQWRSADGRAEPSPTMTFLFIQSITLIIFL